MERFKQLVHSKNKRPDGTYATELFRECEAEFPTAKLPPKWLWYINDLRSSLKYSREIIGRVEVRRMNAQEQAMLLRWKLEDIERQHQWWLICTIVIACIIIAVVIS